jgi:hypothetical protein
MLIENWEEKNNRNFKRFNRDFLYKKIVSFGDYIVIFYENREKISKNRHFRR